MKIIVPSKKKFDFEIDGQSFSMRKPTIVEHEDYVDAYSNAEARKDKQQILFNHLESLGLPSEVSKTLDMEQLDFIITQLTESKKN